MGEKLTKRDVEKIEEEIEHRKLVIRKEAIEAVKEARAQGDLSENFEYYAAKKHKNQNESRIRYLERMLKTATVVDDSSKSDEVGMDDIVEVEFEEDGEVEKYKLVTSIRGNSMENRVSIESPIGKALKGLGIRLAVGQVHDDGDTGLLQRGICIGAAAQLGINRRGAAVEQVFAHAGVATLRKLANSSSVRSG